MCKDKISEFESTISNENSQIQQKINMFSGSTKKNSNEMVKKLEACRGAFLEQCLRIKKRAKSHLQKYCLSVESIKDRLKIISSRSQDAKQNAFSLVQKKSKTAALRINKVQEWQAAEASCIFGQNLLL